MTDTIAVVLTREEAWAASSALAQEAARMAQELGELGDQALASRSASIDAMACGRRLRRTLGALEAVGWPHKHLFDGAASTLTAADERSSWPARREGGA